MLKKIVTLVLLFSIIFCFGKDFRRSPKGEIISHDCKGVVFKSGYQIHKLRKKVSTDNSLNKITTTTVIDTIANFNAPTGASGYTAGFGNYQQQGDTAIAEFNLLAPGKIKKIMVQNSSSGSATFMVWAPSIYWTESGSGYYNFPQYNNPSSPAPGAQKILPWASTMDCNGIEVDDQFDVYGNWAPEWNILDLDEEYPSYNPTLTGDSLDCWVGYRINDEDGPFSIMDDADHYGHEKSFSTLLGQGAGSGVYYSLYPTIDPDAYFAHMIQIVVEYEAVPPFIENTTELSNMYATTATVKADIYDLDSESFTAKVQHKIGANGTVSYINMSATGDGNEYAANISATVGDTVYYVIVASDGELSNYSGDSYTSYIIKEKPTEKKYLVVCEGSTNNDSLYQEVLSDDETLYWIMDDEGGLHKSVVNAGFDVIFVTGYGTTVVPIFDEEDVYEFGNALDNGTDLVLCDPDWAFANKSSKSLTYVELNQGDFAYDYMGIDTLINDPNDGTNSLADEEFIGFSEHPVSSNFVDGVNYGPLVYSILGKTNWGDFVFDNDSEESEIMFVGSETGWPSAVSKANEYYKTVYCGFWPEVVASDQFAEFETFVSNILAQVTSIEEEISNVATEFALNQNYPNPFNPTTRIEYSIPERSQVSLKIYDISGNLVRTLNSGMKNQGRYAVTWDAKNEFGYKVASGVYFYKLQAADNVVTKKMLLMK